jgi:hypothetical protein
MAPLSEFKIGTTLVGLTNIESLTVPLPVPRAPYKPYAKTVTSSSGVTVGKGFPSVIWTFSRLTPVQREQLRTFCTGSSAVVYIRTMINDADAYANYQAVMHWTDDETRDPAKTHDRLELKISFTHLVAA